MENFNQKENLPNLNDTNDKNRVMDDFIAESQNSSKHSLKKGKSSFSSFLLLILTSISLFIGIELLLTSLLLLFLNENALINYFIIIMTLIIMGLIFWKIKINQLQYLKIHYNLFLLFLFFIGWQLIIFAAILGDLSEILEQGWGKGYVIRNGFFLIVGTILTVINVPILSLIYKKSEGLK